MATLFDLSVPGRRAGAQLPPAAPPPDDLPGELLRRDPPALPEVSELEVVRHYTRLSQRNHGVDTGFYPLGSCTMKYNPRGANALAMLPEFLERHPLAPEGHGQGLLACLHDLQEILAAVTGMAAVSLTPAAGAQGEFAGVRMIRAYHEARGDHQRDEMLIPDSAHGTNPASAVMGGCRAREIPTGPDGDLDLEALDAALGPRTAGIMLTNPSTLGLFERNIQAIARRVHAAGGLLYYDGANLNAILGRVRPGDMGFDVVHLNLHKTFATPHGGGGPGAGPVGVSARLEPFLPIPRVGHDGHDYHWIESADRPQSIGRLSAFAGNLGVALRAYVYARMLGDPGLARVSGHAVLNAAYLMQRLRALGYEAAYPDRRPGHEFIITLKREAHAWGVRALDVAKRLLDFGIHAPTTYFPLQVPECLLIEPTETESKAELDRFVEAMARIREEAEHDPERLRGAPWTTPLRRLDDVRAAREPDLAWRPE